jgi:hypothetical protein
VFGVVWYELLTTGDATPRRDADLVDDLVALLSAAQ